MLNDKHFLFWLAFFHCILPHVDVLYDQFHSCSANSLAVRSVLRDFYNAVCTIGTEIYLTSEISGEPPVLKKLEQNEDLTILVKEVCDTYDVKLSRRLKLINYSWADSRVNSLKSNVSGTVSVPIIRAMIRCVTQFDFKQRNGSSLPVTFLHQNCWCPLYNREFPSKELDELC
jgi:hypothetical protein